MSLAIVHSRANAGIAAVPVTVEVHISNGLPGMSIVGLPETAVKESRDRVRSALLHTHFEFPMRRITVNLAPADLPKEGGRFDLPIALGILAASGQIPLAALAEYEFAGELALSGALRPIQGALPFAIATAAAQRSLVLPVENAQEASLVSGLTLLSADHLLAVCGHLLNQQALPEYQTNISLSPASSYPDLGDVHGQHHAKRALKIAAAGGHSLLLIGPPGTGKTMLASRLPGLLPNMNTPESLEVAAIHSISGKSFVLQNWRQRPFRSPHHTISSVALVGGGSPPKPGEISLAHHGVLFLDELPEFNRNVLEALREPLESGHIMISRAAHQAQFPAKFQLIAAMNPCPCGYLGDTTRACRCSPEQVQRYQSRLSGPLLDRIDLQVAVSALSKRDILGQNYTQNETSQLVQEHILQAHELQQQRQNKLNAELTNSELSLFCKLENGAQQLLEHALEKFGLSARTCHRLIKTARTIADLSQSLTINDTHISEALSYRCFDRLRQVPFMSKTS